MSVRVAIVGPGRVGTAVARRLVQGGAVRLLGFVGRRAAATAAAVAAAGAGRPLGWADLGQAHVVLFATGDGDLPAAVAAALQAAPPRPCSLWLHTSGRFGLEVFDAAAARGVRRGALHPVAPFPDPLVPWPAGAPAVCTAEPRSERLLRRLCGWLDLQPVAFAAGGDRLLYHAACALAANGLTALRGLVDAVFAAAGALAPADAARLADALQQQALQLCRERGPAQALSGPVRRGDAATLAAHLAALQAGAPAARPAYAALMAAAVPLAVAAGLPAATAAQLQRQLAAAAEEG